MWTKAKNWNGEDLKGLWEFSCKIDGVRAFRQGDGYVSRNGKPLYNIPLVDAAPEGFEIYKPVGPVSKLNFQATIMAVRAKNKPDRRLAHECIYSLDPVDDRLYLTALMDPSAIIIKAILSIVVYDGYEGLILRGAGSWLKVKPFETYDVRITGFREGKGKDAGRLGAVETPMGRVGTGFSAALRQEIWDRRDEYQNKLIEVSCLQLTPDGKFRHAAFERFRDDKDEEDFPSARAAQDDSS